MGTVTSLFRYPVKGLSAEPLLSVPIAEGAGFPLDRRFALALAATPFSPSEPKPLPKSGFLMRMRDESLADLCTALDPQSYRFTVYARDGGLLLEANLQSDDGRAAVERFFARFVVAPSAGNPRLVCAPGHRFTDVGTVSPRHMEAVSLINFASLRELESAAAKPLHPLRFRANIYVDGLPPWQERSWLDRDVVIGPVRFQCIRRTKRCPAINVNPDTARRDTELTRLLIQDFGHPDMGVYLSALGEGTLSIGDRVDSRLDDMATA